MTFGSSKAFWFEMTAAGYPVLVKPDGTRSHSFRRKAPEQFNSSQQSIDGWRRSMLFIDDNDIWDITAFACTISSMFCCEYGWSNSLLFASCQTAEKAIYPYLSEEQVAQCRRNVDAFYKDKNLQASWSPVILFPVCLKFTKKMDDFEPMYIGDIGDSFLQLGTLEMHPCRELSALKDDEYLREVLYNDRDFDENEDLP